MVKSLNLGFPRVGANRELKKSVENFWNGKLDEKALMLAAKNLRAEHWKVQKDAGVDSIPSNDFSLYDHVLDHSVLFGAVPAAYKDLQGLTRYFAMARGLQKDGVDVQALEMKKWFDTNYHYIVPEFNNNQTFELAEHPKPLVEFKEALDAGVKTRPVLIGPFTFLRLGKFSSKEWKGKEDTLVLLEKLVRVYEALLCKLADAGAEWVQIDEPILSLNLEKSVLEQFLKVYQKLASSKAKILVANYFGPLKENLDTLMQLPVAGVHFDLVRGAEDFNQILARLSSYNGFVSLGVVNGRNIWRSDLNSKLELVQQVSRVVSSERIFVSPSCSLLHSPFSTKFEVGMKQEILEWLCFSVEKLEEIVCLTKALNSGVDSVAETLQNNMEIMQRRKTSALIFNEKVRKEMTHIDGNMFKRKNPFNHRYALQQKKLNLPLFPTTTIGSFPQTQDVRVARQKFKKSEWTEAEYEEFLKQQVQDCIRLQEEIGLDVLVHGESERNDMVEFFGEKMDGYIFTKNGWVQSYGSRCVKPPIIYGDIDRPTAMTVDMIRYAQSLTKRSVKGMLTGPVTMLQWSFVRDDQPRKDTTFQLAWALRKEVVDLEKAGISVIQIDEPAIREGLPLRKESWYEYLKWAVDSFLLCSTGVNDETQIHSHFCYSDFNDVYTSIIRLDADVITIENARSDLKLLEAFKKHKYSNGIGPGIYDIHSPRVPGTEEMYSRMMEISKYVDKNLLWINPDCGLKTRNQKEVVASLKNMVEVAKKMRQMV